MPGRASLLLALLFVQPPSALTQPLWGDLAVPGGIAAARAAFDLGLPGTRPDETWLLDLVQRHHAVGNDGADVIVRSYFDYVALVTNEARACQPGGCVLPTSASPRADRDRARRFLDVIGLRLRERDGVFSAEPEDSDTGRQRRQWLAALGVDTNLVIDRLSAGAAVTIDVAEGHVPLPLPEIWSEVAGRDRALVADIARTSSNALLYAGLFALDDETLAFVGSQPMLLDGLRNGSAGTFAAFGRSVRVQDGQVRTPGGPASATIWDTLVNPMSLDPGAFVLGLLEADGGRLAFFYDTVAQLDPERQAFVLGGHLPPAQRLAFVRSVYQAFIDFAPRWELPLQPFHWRSFDPALVLAFVDVQADGVVGPDWWPALLASAPEWSWDDGPDRLSRDLNPRPADARWLTEWVFETQEHARQRFDSLRFLQRCFAARPLEEAPSIALALRTFSETPALALSLERMGVTDPDVYARLGRAAHALTGGPFDPLEATARWQTAFGLVEQMTRLRRVAPDRLEALLMSLADLALTSERDSPGAGADWVVERLLPAVMATRPDESAGEDTWHAAVFLGGVGPASGDVEWEGLSYRIDTAGAALRGVREIRAVTAGPRLTDLIALHTVRHQLDAAPATVAEVGRLADQLEALLSAVASLPTPDGRAPEAATWLRDAIRALRRVATPQDLDRAARDRRRLNDVAAAIGDVVLPSWLYAMAVAPTSQPAQLFADGWWRHRLATDDGVNQLAVAWRVPITEVDPAGGTFLRGSYLGLDVPLADAQLQAVPSDEVLDPPRLHAEDQRALVQSLAMRESDQLAIAVPDISAIVSALAAGRATLAAWTTAPPNRATQRAALEAAGVGPARINLALWVRETHPAATASQLTVSEVYWLGGGAALPAAWGASSRAVDDCLCFRALDSGNAVWFRGRPGSGLIGSAQSDLPLRLAEHLEAHGLPASLIPLILPSALRAWTDRAWQFVPRDGDALAAFPRELTWSQIEAYLLSLVAHGLLTPPSEPIAVAR